MIGRWHLRDVIATSGPPPDVARETVLGTDHMARVFWPGVLAELPGFWWAVTDVDGTVRACGWSAGGSRDRDADIRRAIVRLGLCHGAVAC